MPELWASTIFFWLDATARDFFLFFTSGDPIDRLRVSYTVIELRLVKKKIEIEIGLAEGRRLRHPDYNELLAHCDVRDAVNAWNRRRRS
jgi:hypothetical protein